MSSKNPEKPNFHNGSWEDGSSSYEECVQCARDVRVSGSHHRVHLTTRRHLVPREWEPEGSHDPKGESQGCYPVCRYCRRHPLMEAVAFAADSDE